MGRREPREWRGPQGPELPPVWLPLEREHHRYLADEPEPDVRHPLRAAEPAGQGWSVPADDDRP